jgi:hypothetical protein
VKKLTYMRSQMPMMRRTPAKTLTPTKAGHAFINCKNSLISSIAFPFESPPANKMQKKPMNATREDNT